MNNNVKDIPHDRAAEEAVVGSVIIDPECFDTIDLIPEDFYIHRHRFIWDAFLALRSDDIPIDFLSLTTMLEKQGNLKNVGGSAFLTALINQVPSSLNVKHYAKEVKDRAMDRKRLAIANQIATGVYSGDLDLPAIIDGLIGTETVIGGAVGVTDPLRELDREVEERIKNPGEVWGIPTGIYDWDRVTGGLQKQETTLIVGPPAVGKTTLILQVGLDVALKYSKHVAIYEMEMDTKRLLYRAIYMLGGPSPRKLKSGYFESGDHEKYINALQLLDNPYLHICDSPFLTTSQVRADLANLKSRYKIELVLVDYLNLFNEKDGRDDNEKAKNRSRQFRAICRESNVCGISIQSLNKEGINKTIADIQDVSGPAEIGFDADWIYTLAKDGDTNIKMVPLKGRDADMTGTISLIKKGLRFYNTTKFNDKDNRKDEWWNK